MTDAGQLAAHLLWAAETEAAHDQDFNIVNGDVFRWQWMWGRIADWFGVKAASIDGTVHPLEQQMADDAPLWRAIAEREGLVEPDLSRLASPWHTDADLGSPIEVVTNMSKSRRLGFTGYVPTGDARSRASIAAHFGCDAAPSQRGASRLPGGQGEGGAQARPSPSPSNHWPARSKHEHRQDSGTGGAALRKLSL